MKKYFLILAFIFIALTAVNLFYFRSIYHMQVNQQKNMLFKQSEICVDNLEQTILRFESDLNFILFNDDITGLFANQDSEYLQKLKLFYTTYDGLIKNIDIYDNNKNVFNLFRDRKHNFIADGYLAQRQRKLIEKEDVRIDKEEYIYVLPVFKNNKLYANILVTINITDFILSELENFRLDEVTWQWAIDRETETIYNTSNINYNWNGALESVLNELKKDNQGLIIHTISNDSLNHKILSVYAPANLLNHEFGISLSVDHATFLTQVYSKLIVLVVISMLLFLGLGLFFIMQIRQLKKKIEA